MWNHVRILNSLILSMTCISYIIDTCRFAFVGVSGTVLDSIRVCVIAGPCKSITINP